MLKYKKRFIILALVIVGVIICAIPFILIDREMRVNKCEVMRNGRKYFIPSLNSQVKFERDPDSFTIYFGHGDEFGNDFIKQNFRHCVYDYSFTAFFVSPNKIYLLNYGKPESFEFKSRYYDIEIIESPIEGTRLWPEDSILLMPYTRKNSLLCGYLRFAAANRK